MMQSLRQLAGDWVKFAALFLNPWSLLFLITTGILLYASSIQTDKTIITILTLLNTVSSGILGGIISSKLAKITETDILIARGHTAIRNLKVLLNNIMTTQGRVVGYIEKVNAMRDSKDIAIVYLEEIISGYGILAEEVINSTENWIDIIPEANVKTQIGTLTKLAIDITNKKEEISRLNTEIEEIKNTSADEASKLRLLVSRKEGELREVRANLLNKSIDFGGTLTAASGIGTVGVPTIIAASGIGTVGVPTPVAASSDLAASAFNPVMHCKECKQFKSTAGFIDRVCSDCRAKK